MSDWQRLFFPTFPRGRSGTGLILIRAAIAITALVQGTSCLISSAQSRLVTAESLLALAAGALLLIGLWTPVAAAALGLCLGVMKLFLVSSCGMDLFDTDLSVILAISVCTGILLAGPGAYSIDARLFGPREIVFRSDSDPRS